MLGLWTIGLLGRHALESPHGSALPTSGERALRNGRPRLRAASGTVGLWHATAKRAPSGILGGVSKLLLGQRHDGDHDRQSRDSQRHRRDPPSKPDEPRSSSTLELPEDEVHAGHGRRTLCAEVVVFLSGLLLAQSFELRGCRRDVERHVARLSPVRACHANALRRGPSASWRDLRDVPQARACPSLEIARSQPLAAASAFVEHSLHSRAW